MSNDSPRTVIGPQEVLAFWRAAGPDRWFSKNSAFDSEVAVRFFSVYRAAAAGALQSWERDPETALALVITLDQFPRNMFRGQAQAFETDPLARGVADRAIARGFDHQVPKGDQQFFYLPFMHSEDIADQQRCIALARAAGDEHLARYAEQHADIIRLFGRFPHRNTILGRVTSPDEQAFLDAGGFAG
jgi:uncharacterized protein (DUF924 family)